MDLSHGETGRNGPGDTKQEKRDTTEENITNKHQPLGGGAPERLSVESLSVRAQHHPEAE